MLYLQKAKFPQHVYLHQLWYTELRNHDNNSQKTNYEKPLMINLPLNCVS